MLLQWTWEIFGGLVGRRYIVHLSSSWIILLDRKTLKEIYSNYLIVIILDLPQPSSSPIKTTNILIFGINCWYFYYFIAIQHSNARAIIHSNMFQTKVISKNLFAMYNFLFMSLKSGYTVAIAYWWARTQCRRSIKDFHQCHKNNFNFL